MKRGLYEIWACILRRALKPTKKTHLMYACTLQWYQFLRHLKLLVETNLLTVNSDLYVATEKGQRFLTAYENLRAVMEE